MEKDNTYIIFDIRNRTMFGLGIDPQEGIDHLERKMAVTINPVHVRALEVLKQKPAVASS